MLTCFNLFFAVYRSLAPEENNMPRVQVINHLIHFRTSVVNLSFDDLDIHQLATSFFLSRKKVKPDM